MVMMMKIIRKIQIVASKTIFIKVQITNRITKTNLQTLISMIITLKIIINKTQLMTKTWSFRCKQRTNNTTTKYTIKSLKEMMTKDKQIYKRIT